MTNQKSTATTQPPTRAERTPPMRSVYADALLHAFENGGVNRLLHVLRLASERGSGLSRRRQSQAYEYHGRLAALLVDMGPFLASLRDSALDGAAE